MRARIEKIRVRTRCLRQEAFLSAGCAERKSERMRSQERDFSVDWFIFFQSGDRTRGRLIAGWLACDLIAGVQCICTYGRK